MSIAPSHDPPLLQALTPSLFLIALPSGAVYLYGNDSAATSFWGS